MLASLVWAGIILGLIGLAAFWAWWYALRPYEGNRDK